METPMRILFGVLLASLIGSAAMACSTGARGQAYDLGHQLAFTGIDTTPADEVGTALRTCFAIGYREGRLQRLLRTSQPNPPTFQAVRPRNTQKG